MPNKMIDLSPGQVLGVCAVKAWLKAVGRHRDAIHDQMVQHVLDSICHHVDDFLLHCDVGPECELTTRQLEQCILNAAPQILWPAMGTIHFHGFQLFKPSLEQEAALGAIMGGHDFEASRVPRDAFA